MKRVAVRQERLSGWLIVTAVLLMSVPPASAVKGPPTHTRPSNVISPTILAAGIPSPTGLRRDYARTYRELERGGMTVYFPYFATSEAGGSPDFEYEDFYGRQVDFAGEAATVARCDRASPAFAQLASHHVKLLLSADVMYPASGFPSIADDPLRRLIACAGGARNIYGVLNYDEPALHGTPIADLRRVYDRVKRIAPSLPVLMVNGPILKKAGVTRFEVAAYFRAVKASQAAADIIGFDVYPIPDTVRDEIISPYRATDSAPSAVTLIAEYARWLSENGRGKPTWMVLQAFTKPITAQFRFDGAGSEPHPCESRNGDPDVASICGSGTRGPTEAELRGMVKATQDAGAGVFGWYGASFVSQEDLPGWRPTPLWESVIKVSLNAAKARLHG